MILFKRLLVLLSRRRLLRRTAMSIVCSCCCCGLQSLGLELELQLGCLLPGLTVRGHHPAGRLHHGLLLTHRVLLLLLLLLSFHLVSRSVRQDRLQQVWRLSRGLVGGRVHHGHGGLRLGLPGLGLMVLRLRLVRVGLL